MFDISKHFDEESLRGWTEKASTVFKLLKGVPPIVVDGVGCNVCLYVKRRVIPVRFFAILGAKILSIYNGIDNLVFKMILPLFAVLHSNPIMRTFCLAAVPRTSVAQTSLG
jgi:hypothetical protein